MGEDPKKQIPSGTRINHKGANHVARSTNQHITDQELNALVPSRFEAGSGPETDSSQDVIETRRHVASCLDCRNKVQKYSLLVDLLPKVLVKPAPAGLDCPQHVDWDEVAAGLWPERRAKQAMMHAALCEHCGPSLRAAAQRVCVMTSAEEQLRAQWKASSRPHRNRAGSWRRLLSQAMAWWAPVAVAIVIAGVLSTWSTAPRTSISAAQFAELAVRTHRQHIRGELALGIRSESQQAVNDWLKKTSPFTVVLPASPPAPAEEMSYLPEGARLVQAGGQWADFIAYRMKVSERAMTPTRPLATSLMVIPASVVKASGGIEARFAKVTFHYETVDGYKVVTWSVHGLTYALVSEEGNNTQRSCMVCHSAMHDRDLSHTPSPLLGPDNGPKPVWQ
jgi:hypothetical protein